MARVAVAVTRRADAVARARSHLPALILADVRLADESSGIAAVADIQAFDNAPVVFITAYPERLLTGEQPEPAFLIPKPFLPRQVRAMVEQAVMAAYLEEPH